MIGPFSRLQKTKPSAVTEGGERIEHLKFPPLPDDCQLIVLNGEVTAEGIASLLQEVFGWEAP